MTDEDTAAAQQRAEQKKSKPQKQDKPQKTADSNKKIKIAVIIAAAVVAVLLVGTAGFGIYVSGTDTIFPGVHADGTLVGGLTREQAADTLRAVGWGGKDGETVTVRLPLDKSITVTAEEAGASLTPEDAAVMLYDHCHDGNIFKNLTVYLKSWFGGTDLKLMPSASETAVRAKVESAVAEVSAGLMSSGLEIGEKDISVVKGAKAVEISSDDICALIVTALNSRSYGEIEYEIKVDEAVELDIDELYDSVYAEAKDAAYDAEKGEIIPAVTGRDFDKAEAKRLWDLAAVGDTVIIPMELEEPAITTELLQKKLFADELATSTTSLAGSSKNRITNIKLAAGIISGKVIQPGETFSYNETLGQRTAERGFKAAGAYSGGQVVQEIGGGICQLSSTIYHCSLLANLKITDRTCHYFPVGYLPAGLDATVSWKKPEFKFTNSREYPVRLDISVDEKKNTLTVNLMGTDVDGSYVKLTYATWQVFNNKEFPEIATGYKAATYRWIYDKSDKLISKTLEAYSEYHYHDEDIKYPTPSPSATPSPSPSAKPTATPTTTPSSPSDIHSPETPAVTPVPTLTPNIAPTPTLHVG
ncbi:MAG: VanW family protein [Oscillospiraceae bacterium]